MKFSINLPLKLALVFVSETITALLPPVGYLPPAQTLFFHALSTYQLSRGNIDYQSWRTKGAYGIIFQTHRTKK